MGYRSNVSIVLYTCKQDVVPTEILHFWFDENFPHREAKQEWEAQITKGDGYVLIEYEDVKWYDGYTHPGQVTQALETFIATFDEEEQGYVAWETMRVGEELNDIERDASMYADWRLDVSRTIHFN